jgi:hypothetical protein
VFYKGKGWASWRDWIGYEQGDPRELMAIEPTGVTPLMEAARRGDVAQVKVGTIVTLNSPIVSYGGTIVA